jgi:hypothetical protein
MSALENVLVGLRPRARSRGENDVAALSLLEYVGLAHLAENSVAGLPLATLKRFANGAVLDFGSVITTGAPDVVLLVMPHGAAGVVDRLRGASKGRPR